MKKLMLLTIAALLAIPAVGAVKHATPSSNLGRLIRGLGNADTLMVAAGDYIVEGTLPVKKNIVIIGEQGAKPRISISLFTLAWGAERLILENLELTLNRKYLVSADKSGNVAIDLICVKDCIVNMGGGEGACLVTSGNEQTANNRIGEIRIENSIVYNAGFPSHAIYNGGSSSQTKVGKIALLNSTLADTSRGLIATNAAMDGIEIVIENSTFYRINTTNNNSGTIRLSNAPADIRISNSVFSFAGSDTRFIITGTGSKYEVTDSYYTNEVSSIRGSFGLKSLPLSAAGLFESPSEEPTGPGVSFRAKAGVPEGARPGDPRWYR